MEAVVHMHHIAVETVDSGKNYSRTTPQSCFIVHKDFILKTL